MINMINMINMSTQSIWSCEKSWQSQLYNRSSCDLNTGQGTRNAGHSPKIIYGLLFKIPHSQMLKFLGQNSSWQDCKKNQNDIWRVVENSSLQDCAGVNTMACLQRQSPESWGELLTSYAFCISQSPITVNHNFYLMLCSIKPALAYRGPWCPPPPGPPTPVLTD